MEGILEKEEIVPEDMLKKVEARTKSSYTTGNNRWQPRVSTKRNLWLQVREIMIVLEDSPNSLGMKNRRRKWAQSASAGQIAVVQK